MSAIRQSGKVNENTTLIDIGMSDVYSMTAVYLVEGKRKCLIDGGTRNDAPGMVKMLSKLGAFPPDLIIVTHPHWDHSYKISDTIFLLPFMPTTWDRDAFLSSVNKLKQIPYATLCLAHFGDIYGSEARSILDEAVETRNTWWQWYERNADRLNDTDYLLQAMRKEINPGIPNIDPTTLPTPDDRHRSPALRKLG